MLEFLPLVASDSIPSSRLARHLTLRLHLHFVLFTHCTDRMTGILLWDSVSPKLRDTLLSEPPSSTRSRQDLRLRSSTVLRMALSQRSKKTYHRRRNVVDVVYSRDLVPEVQVSCNELSIQPEWI
jgi:hypothetical protein